MSLKKRLALSSALAASLTIGMSAPSIAQGHYHGYGGHGAVVVGGGYYHGYYGGGFYFGSPFWYGYPWWPYAYPYPPYPYYPYPYYYADGSVRLEVTPKEAEVFVDGYYAGIVDDFDGIFQRLHVPLGQHEITLYREGYRSVHQSVSLSADTFKIKFAMVKLAPGDVQEPRPTPPPPPPASAQSEPPQDQPLPPPGRRGGGRPYPPPPPPPDQGASHIEAAVTSGTLVIRAQPDGATILIDGERWQGPVGQERLVVAVTDGSHHVQVEKEGYEPFATDVTTHRGETTPLNVSLRSH